MPRVFKKTITRHWIYATWINPAGLPCAAGAPGATFVESRRVPAGTPGAVVVKEKSTNYFGRVPGKREPVPLCANKAASETMLSDLIGKSVLKGRGLNDPYEEHRKRPLLEHLDDFIASLTARGNCPHYVAETRRHVSTFLAGVKAVLVGDIHLSAAQEWLVALREDEPAPLLLPGQEEFTIREAGASLGIKPTSVWQYIRRNQVPTMGKGPTRRIARARVQEMADRAARGASPQTVNHHVRSIGAFFRWLVKPARRVPFNPLDGLEMVHASTDRRRNRRELTTEELRHLLAATRSSAKVFRGLTGEARFHLYACACGTGFRASGLDSLTPECFSFAGKVPVVTLPVRGDKSRRGKLQPLPADVADLMRAWLQGKPAGQPLWPGKWASERQAAEMLRIDLAAAGIPYVTQGPDGPLYADFHALRHTYLTLGGRAGIDLRTLQELAGHSKSSMTERYTHVRLHDLAGAVEKLPAFLPASEPPPENLRAGTGQEPENGMRRKA